jgi:hypothetical protein
MITSSRHQSPLSHHVSRYAAWLGTFALAMATACREPSSSPNRASVRQLGGRGGRPTEDAEPAGGGGNAGDPSSANAGDRGGGQVRLKPVPATAGGLTGRGGKAGAETGGEQADEPGGAGAGPARPSAPFSSVRCSELPVTDGCEVTGTGDALVLRGGVLTPGVVYEAGSVRVSAQGVIECAGCACDTEGARVVTCGDAIVSPGFVNPHDHVAYDAEPPRPLGPERYEHRHDWRLGLRGHAAIEYEGGASPIARAAQELRMLLGGVTTLAGGAGHRGLARNPDMADLGEGLPTAPADSETFPLDDSDGRLVTSGCGYGKNHATSDDVERSGAYLAHLGEGIDLAAENELACALGADFGLIEPTTAVVHAVAARARIAAELGARHALVVWSPRSNVALYGNTAPVPLLLRSGVDVALGTDWLLSGSMSLLRELRCARDFSTRYFDGALDDHALFLMSTASAARAVGAGDALGRLAAGWLGDVSVIARHGREPYTAAVSAEPADFMLIVRSGAPVYGRRALLDALGSSGCEPLDVCGAPQSVCAAGSDFTLAELQATADATYPLVACGEPPNEPTCVPSRPDEYDGTAREGDRDGDGVADGDDACPSVFDPPRPLDDGTQADADGDGLGDACDPCPLDAAPGCERNLMGDRDGDGVPDGVDTCPDTPDPEQGDADGDGRGDACDYCSAPNPGISPCPMPIAAIRRPDAESHPPRHALIQLDGAVVSALRPDSASSRGFYLQANTEPLAGVFVYTSSNAPEVSLGDRVSLRARYDRYYELDELVAPNVLTREPGAAPLPLTLAAEDIGDAGALGAAYDSMLVSVTDVRVVSTNPDAPSDYDETGLTGALRLDDLLYPDLDNTFPTDTGFTRLTGILARSFDHQKLLPRGEADIGPN